MNLLLPLVAQDILSNPSTHLATYHSPLLYNHTQSKILRPDMKGIQLTGSIVIHFNGLCNKLLNSASLSQAYQSQLFSTSLQLYLLSIASAFPCYLRIFMCERKLDLKINILGFGNHLLLVEEDRWKTVEENCGGILEMCSSYICRKSCVG